MTRVLALFYNGRQGLQAAYFLSSLKITLEKRLAIILHTLLGTELVVKAAMLVRAVRQLEGESYRFYLFALLTIKRVNSDYFGAFIRRMDMWKCSS